MNVALTVGGKVDLDKLDIHKRNGCRYFTVNPGSSRDFTVKNTLETELSTYAINKTCKDIAAELRHSGIPFGVIDQPLQSNRSGRQAGLVLGLLTDAAFDAYQWLSGKSKMHSIESTLQKEEEAVKESIQEAGVRIHKNTDLVKRVNANVCQLGYEEKVDRIKNSIDIESLSHAMDFKDSITQCMNGEFTRPFIHITRVLLGFLPTELNGQIFELLCKKLMPTEFCETHKPELRRHYIHCVPKNVSKLSIIALLLIKSIDTY